MKEIRSDVEKLVKKELESANQQIEMESKNQQKEREPEDLRKEFEVIKYKSLMSRSHYVAAMLIFDEIEKCEKKLNDIKESFSAIQISAKRGVNVNELMEVVHSDFVTLACEAIQVAAMAQKFVDTREEREKSEGN